MSSRRDSSHILGNFDPATPPPAISSTTKSDHRPKWSVMIPTYNCAAYLRQALDSVLSQDPGPEEMQIEVIDDGSTRDDPEMVVRSVGAGRVCFHRKETNEGATKNFNTCIQRSRGEFVHILHGDDFILPGFYKEIERLSKASPQSSLFASRSFFVDANGVIDGITPRLPELTAGANDTNSFLYGTPLQFSGVVIKRAFYESHGGYRENLVHTADWEMWERVIRLDGGIVSDEALSAYRIFPGNDTGRLMRTGGNLVDRLRLIETFASRWEGFPRNDALKKLVKYGRAQEQRYRLSNDTEAAAANFKIWRAIDALRNSRIYRILLNIRNLFYCSARRM